MLTLSSFLAFTVNVCDPTLNYEVLGLIGLTLKPLNPTSYACLHCLHSCMEMIIGSRFGSLACISIAAKRQ